MATESQTNIGIPMVELRSGGGIRAGQRLTITNRTVTKLSFYICKSGSATGNVTFTIRKVSNDSVIVSKLWGNASALPTDMTWEEVTFDTPTFINEEVRISTEFSGGSSGNGVMFSATASDVKAGEVYTTYSASWGDASWGDATYIYTFTEGGSAAPVITTQACTYVIAQGATGNGNLQSLGTSAVTQHGHCWNTSTNPTTSNSKTTNGPTANLGPFQSSITGLTPGTLYYVRAYATNTSGTSYGANVQIAGSVTTIGKRYWWVEGKEFHYYDQWGAERKVEGIPDASGLPWWFYY